MDASQFDLHARVEDFHWWFKARRKIIYDLLVKSVPPQEGRTIVEIGCGTGGNLLFLQKYYDIMGIDISHDAVRYARKRVRCPVVHGDFKDILNAAWNQFDAVILPDVLEHIENDRIFLESIIKSIEPGTIILITVPAHQWLWSHHDIMLGHERRYSLRALRSLWQGQEVEEVFLSSFNFVLSPLAIFIRLIKRGVPSSRKSDLLFLPASLLNALLYIIFSVERILLRFCRLPFGISYVAVIKKKEMDNG